MTSASCPRSTTNPSAAAPGDRVPARASAHGRTPCVTRRHGVREPNGLEAADVWIDGPAGAHTVQLQAPCSAGPQTSRARNARPMPIIRPPANAQPDPQERSSQWAGAHQVALRWESAMFAQRRARPRPPALDRRARAPGWRRRDAKADTCWLRDNGGHSFHVTSAPGRSRRSPLLG